MYKSPRRFQLHPVSFHFRKLWTKSFTTSAIYAAAAYATDATNIILTITHRRCSELLLDWRTDEPAQRRRAAWIILWRGGTDTAPNKNKPLSMHHAAKLEPKPPPKGCIMDHHVLAKRCSAWNSPYLRDFSHVHALQIRRVHPCRNVTMCARTESRVSQTIRAMAAGRKPAAEQGRRTPARGNVEDTSQTHYQEEQSRGISFGSEANTSCRHTRTTWTHWKTR